MRIPLLLFIAACGHVKADAPQLPAGAEAVTEAGYDIGKVIATFQRPCPSGKD